MRTAGSRREVKVLWNHALSSCKWETPGCRAVGHDQWSIRLFWIPVPQGHSVSLVFTFFPHCFPFLSYHRTEFTAKFPETFPKILELSRCNQKCLHCWLWGTSRGAATEPCSVQPLLLFFGSLASCYAVAPVQKSLGKWGTALQFKPCLCIQREENKPQTCLCSGPVTEGPELLVVHKLLNGILSNGKETTSRSDWRRKKTPSCGSLALLRCDLLDTALPNAREHSQITACPPFRLLYRAGTEHPLFDPSSSFYSLHFQLLTQIYVRNYQRLLLARSQALTMGFPTL